MMIIQQIMNNLLSLMLTYNLCVLTWPSHVTLCH